jgi:hypothetical protein
MMSWRSAVDHDIQSPMMAAPDHIVPMALGAIGYRKPGAVMLALRDNVVGRDVMDMAFREYAHRWAFKHPTPGDFFRTVENASGQDLSWFWRGFFYSTDVLDIGIDSVANRANTGQSPGGSPMSGAPAAAAPGERTAVVFLRRHTSIVFPVTLRLQFGDGSTQDVSLPVDIWALGDRFAASVTVRAPVTGVRLWTDPFVPDWDPSNDTWGTPPPAGSLTVPATAGGLSGLSGQPSVQ